MAYNSKSQRHKRLTIEIDYLQGDADWDKRPVSCMVVVRDCEEEFSDKTEKRYALMDHGDKPFQTIQDAITAVLEFQNQNVVTLDREQ